MRTSLEQHSLHSLVHLLSEGNLTSSEIYFLIRRLGYKTDDEAWMMLHAYYGQVREVLIEVERRILLRVSPDGLAKVDRYLDANSFDEPDTELNQFEYANLKALVDRALASQLKIKLLRQERPDPAVLLAEDDTPQRTSRKSAKSSEKIKQPAPKMPKSAAKSSVRNQLATNQSASTAVSSQYSETKEQLNDLRLPASLDTHPDRFLEALWLVHSWLIESPRTVRQLLDYLNRHWRLRSHDHTSALDLFYAVGIITRTNPRAPRTQVMRTLSAELTVAEFRRACAKSFVWRVAGNDRLLALLDRLNTAPINRITQLAFRATSVPDLPARLAVWEALGIAAFHRKEGWSITPAGRALAETLPQINLMIEENFTSIPIKIENDWLNVL